MPQLRRLTLLLFACTSLGGCFELNPGRLDQDELGYSQAMGEADKRQTLLNIIRLRYGDSPAFLQATQVISGYQLQRNVTGATELFPAAEVSTFLSGTASAQLQQSPTFTFQPMTGQQFAQSFVHPLPPADLLSLAIGGLPIDVLFRLGVQSVNGMNNAMGLTDVDAAGSPEFFLLLHDLRRLQVAGLLGVSLQQAPPPKEDGKTAPKAAEAKDGSTDTGNVILSIGPTSDPALAGAAAEVRQLLGAPPNAKELEVVYGRVATKKGQVAIFTRSILGALEQVAIQVEVPPADIARHATQATVGNIGVESRPVIVIHSGKEAPDAAFATIEYQGSRFWIDNDDFDSKLAYTVLQILIAVAKTGAAPGTVITIPAG